MRRVVSSVPSASHIKKTELEFCFPTAVSVPCSIILTASWKLSIHWDCSVTHPLQHLLISSVPSCVLWGYWNLMYSCSLHVVSPIILGSPSNHPEKSFTSLIPCALLIQCLVSKCQTLDSTVYLHPPGYLKGLLIRKGGEWMEAGVSLWLGTPGKREIVNQVTKTNW